MKGKSTENHHCESINDFTDVFDDITAFLKVVPEGAVWGHFGARRAEAENTRSTENGFKACFHEKKILRLSVRHKQLPFGNTHTRKRLRLIQSWLLRGADKCDLRLLPLKTILLRLVL